MSAVNQAATRLQPGSGERFRKAYLRAAIRLVDQNPQVGSKEHLSVHVTIVMDTIWNMLSDANPTVTKEEFAVYMATCARLIAEGKHLQPVTAEASDV